MGAVQQDDLYGLALERFVPERTSLARALRADGRRDEAAAVAGARKPSVAAWAVNQLVRSQGPAVKELFDAGDALRQAQAALLAGRGDGGALRAARERERVAVDGLVDSARGLLSSQGHELSPATLDRVLDTLHAAALDDSAREQVRAGRLERELRHAGLGLGEAEAAAATTTTPPPPPPASVPRTKRGAGKAGAKSQRAERDEEARRRAAEAARAEREHAAALKAARSAETTARRRAQRTARALRAAEERREHAAQALDEADETLAAARAEADAAADAHRSAQANLEGL
ncbi:MAG: hypothetical protein QOD83_4327 [Solirubrobacteraceae bacterium]|jgi:hypothetical protein|nr:hypothetical protein [Solirubrobacteraceae bacterium]